MSASALKRFKPSITPYVHTSSRGFNFNVLIKCPYCKVSYEAGAVNKSDADRLRGVFAEAMEEHVDYDHILELRSRDVP